MDFSVEADAEGGLVLKLQTDDWEVNVLASAESLLQLSDIRAARWDDRHSIQAGESAGAPVFWASIGDGDHAALMIGRDDETWDVSVSIPFEVIDGIVREVARL